MPRRAAPAPRHATNAPDPVAEGHPTPAGALVLTLPMPASVTNASGASRHWRSRWAEQRALRTALDWRRLAGLIPPPPAVPIVCATVRATLYLGNAMDDDNAMARCKPLLDWLVTRGYLVDDRRKNLRWEGLPEQVVSRKQEYRVVLTITPRSA